MADLFRSTALHWVAVSVVPIFRPTSRFCLGHFEGEFLRKPCRRRVFAQTVDEIFVFFQVELSVICELCALYFTKITVFVACLRTKSLSVRVAETSFFIEQCSPERIDEFREPKYTNHPPSAGSVVAALTPQDQQLAAAHSLLAICLRWHDLLSDTSIRKLTLGADLDILKDAICGCDVLHSCRNFAA